MPDNPKPSADPPSSGHPSRKFTVRDAMILVAAVAVGALGYRVNDERMTETGFDREFHSEVWAMLCGPTLAALTAGLVVARLLPPRPTRCELFRQPGFAAGCIALVLTARRFLEYYLIDRFVDWLDDWFLAMEWVGAMKETSLSILITWLVLALAGCLRAERGWIDRASRVVAVVWVLAGIAVRLVPLIQYALLETL